MAPFTIAFRRLQTMIWLKLVRVRSQTFSLIKGPQFSAEVFKQAMPQSEKPCYWPLKVQGEVERQQHHWEDCTAAGGEESFVVLTPSGTSLLGIWGACRPLYRAPHKQVKK